MLYILYMVRKVLKTAEMAGIGEVQKWSFLQKAKSYLCLETKKRHFKLFSRIKLPN